MVLSKDKKLYALYKRLEKAERKVELIKCEIIYLEGGYGDVSIDSTERKIDETPTEKSGDGKPQTFVLVPPGGI